MQYYTYNKFRGLERDYEREAREQSLIDSKELDEYLMSLSEEEWEEILKEFVTD